ncbi:MAG TPA: LapA family protein [Spirochaetota bacterium]|nr:LapA family protein [Spirochaetota bacterium]HQO03864.1 LapA family protein [Spirochaetota bacterium]HQP47253.1 LapA family protein [Spirochaetota bacterium]
MNFKTSMMITLVVLASVIATQNTHPVQLKFLFWNMEMPLILFILIILLLGFALGFFYTGIMSLRKKRAETREIIEGP